MADIIHNGEKLLPSGIAMLMAEATGWRPEQGSEVEGTVLGVKIGSSSFGTYPIVFVLPDDEDPIALHCFHTVLENEMRSQRPERGDRLYVKYLGPKDDWKGPKGFSAPELYAVLVTKPGAEARSAWDQLPSQTPAPDTASGQFNDEPNF
jgi:hypothetical protein